MLLHATSNSYTVISCTGARTNSGRRSNKILKQRFASQTEVRLAFFFSMSCKRKRSEESSWTELRELDATLARCAIDTPLKTAVRVLGVDRSQQKEKRKKQKRTAFAYSSLLKHQMAALNKVGCTPYGNVLAYRSLETLEGPHEWEYVDPFALLSAACTRSPLFNNFLVHSLRNEPKLVLYTDEFVRGNPLHPTMPTEVTGFYWTFANFPYWWRARKNGWFYLGLLHQATIRSLPSGLSSMVQHILRIFFKGTFNMATGIVIETPSKNLFRIAVPHVDAFLQDLKAHQHTYNVSGASGTRCCWLCHNIYKTHGDCELDLSAHPSQKHFAKAKWADCKLHTAENYWAMTETLDRAKVDFQKARQNYKMKLLQQSLGLSHDPMSLLWNKELRPFYDPVRSSYIDSTHCLTASGGVAQYHMHRHQLWCGD